MISYKKEINIFCVYTVLQMYKHKRTDFIETALKPALIESKHDSVNQLEWISWDFCIQLNRNNNIQFFSHLYDIRV